MFVLIKKKKRNKRNWSHVMGVSILECSFHRWTLHWYYLHGVMGWKWEGITFSLTQAHKHTKSLPCGDVDGAFFSAWGSGRSHFFLFATGFQSKTTSPSTCCQFHSCGWLHRMQRDTHACTWMLRHCEQDKTGQPGSAFRSETQPSHPALS